MHTKGLVLKSPSTKKQLFTAKEPGEFLHERKHDIQTFEELMPKLRALEHNTNRPNILYFDGMQEAISYMFDRVGDNTIQSFFTYSPEGVSQRRFSVMQDFFHVLAKSGIKLQALMPRHELTLGTLEETKERLRKQFGFTYSLRFLPLEQFSPLVSKHITGDLVLTISRRKQQCIIVENKDIADAERQNFQMLWEYAGMIGDTA